MSRVLFYFHVVWATKRRQPWLTPDKEQAVYRCVLKMVPERGCEVLAINGMPDHVHLLLKSGPRIDLSLLMKHVKGVTSTLVNDMTNHAEHFRWQEGYYAVTVTPSHLPKVQAYVQNQKEHHRTNSTSNAWEETGEDEEEGG
jgi:putative transposase